VSRGRPLRDRVNNWNAEWYPQLRMLANTCIGHTGRQDIDPDELVNEAWIKVARRLNPQEKRVPYRKRIRCGLYTYMHAHCHSLECAEFDWNEDDDRARPCKQRDLERADARMDCDTLLAFCDPVTMDMLYSRYGLGESCGEIGKRYNRTGQAISKRILNIRKDPPWDLTEDQ
jgi:DNA-directed RNA polymerase specialized sigma24 family protein